MKNPILTIGVASWGIEEWMLKKNLESLIESLKLIPKEKIEILFMDDLDPKKSYKKAEKAFESFENVKIIRNKVNLKLAKGKTEFMKYAKGKYFQRVDADDWVDPIELARFVGFLEKEDKDIYINGYVEQGRSKKFKNKIRHPRGRSHMFTGNVTYKTSILKQVPEPRYITNMSEDAWLIIQSLMIASSFKHTKFVWYNYRGKGSSGVFDFIDNLDEFEKSTYELTQIKFKSRNNFKKVRTLRMAEHVILRALTGMVYFKAIKYNTRVGFQAKEVKRKFINHNENLVLSFKKDWYHNNIYKFTFSWFVAPFNPLIKKIIIWEGKRNKARMRNQD